MRSRTGTRTSEDHDFREFLDEDGQDEDQNREFPDYFGRGRGQFSEISGTSEDEDGEDVDVLRRPAKNPDIPDLQQCLL